MSKRGRNAYRHGAQAEPDLNGVVAHLERITGVAPGELNLKNPTPEIAAALHLAACEAKLDETHAHYAAAQEIHRDRDLDEMLYLIEDILYSCDLSPTQTKDALRRIMKVEHYSVFASQKRLRLANRYLAEAQSRRLKALRNYLSFTFTETKLNATYD